MNKFFLFLIDIATGLSLAIQVLIHPTFDASARTMYLVAAIIFINWAVFTWLAYSSAIKEKKLSSAVKTSSDLARDDTDQRRRSLLNVTTVAYLVVILVALVSLNVLVFLEMTETTYVVWVFLTAILLPLLITGIANRVLSRGNQKF